MKCLFAVFVSVSVLCAGCSMTSGTKKAPDGSDLSIRNSRFLWSSEGVDFTLTDTNGFSVGLKIKKSRPDVEALQAVAEGVAKGVVAGAK